MINLLDNGENTLNTDDSLLITHIILVIIIILLIILELNRSYDDDSKSIQRVRIINRRNWNASTERISLLSAILSGIIISHIMEVNTWVTLLMIILIIFIVVYFASSWLSSHWYKNVHEKIDNALIRFDKTH